MTRSQYVESSFIIMNLFVVFIIEFFIITPSYSSRDFGKRCRNDSVCSRSLRCYRGICQCRESWIEVSGICQPPDGLEDGKGTKKKNDGYEILAVLMPAIFFGSFILLFSICACIHVHKGNRELHRELKKEYRRNKDVIDRYSSSAETENDEDPEQIDDNRTSILRPVSPDIVIDNHYTDDSDSDKADPENIVRKFSDINTIDIEDTEDNFMQMSSPKPLSESVLSPSEKPSRTVSSLSVRSLERKQSGLHPLNGLIHPTGLVPQGGYQANMRLLFKQRPASAISLGADTAASHFMLKSRPASAISRISTVPSSSTSSKPLQSQKNPFNSSETETDEEESTFLNSQTLMEGLKPAYRNEISVTESMKRFSKNNNVKLANGHVKNGSVKTGILKTSSSRKTSDADSDVTASVSHKSSVSSTSSVTFASEIRTSDDRRLQKQTSSSSSSSSVNSVSSKRIPFKRQSSTASIKACNNGETVMEKILR